MLTMYLARHGETEENRAQILQGQTGGHLTELGISQAHKLGEKLADEVFDAVISSPLKRAVDTTNIVLGYGHENEIELCDLLKERDWGEYTLHSYAERCRQVWKRSNKAWNAEDNLPILCSKNTTGRKFSAWDTDS